MIERLPTHRLYLAPLLRAIAKVPAGEKLNIRALRDPLAIGQADTLLAIELLIAEGRLDPGTLRPPAAAVPPATPPRPTGADLYQRLMAAAAPRGMTQSAVSQAAFGNSVQMCTMRRANFPVRAKTLEHAEAWLATLPPVAAAARVEEVRVPIEPMPTGAELAAELDALIAAHCLSKTKVSVHLFSVKGGIESLRRRPRIKPVTIDKVRALLADPPLDSLRRERQPKAAPTAAKARRRDPTAKPPTPLLDEADRQRANGQRHSASIRKANEQRAAELLDAGKSGRNTYQRALMGEIVRRRAEEARQEDPVERAKLALQRKGRTVYASSVVGGPANRFVVSGLGCEVTPAALIAEAERITGLSFRRAAE